MWPNVGGHNGGLVFKGNTRSRVMGDHDSGTRFPGMSTIGRAADEDSIAGCAMGPVLAGAQLVESDIAEQWVAAGIIGKRNIAGDAVIFRRSAFSDCPRFPAIAGVSRAGVHLPRNRDLLRIAGIYRNGRFIEVTRLGIDVSDVELGRGSELLRGDVQYQQ